MQLGMIGIGRMGANIVRRFQRAGHECVVFDRNPAAVNQLAGEGATGAASWTTLSRSCRDLAPPGSWSRPPSPVRW